jgi:hypothetical protein
MQGFRNEKPVFGFRWIARHGGLLPSDPRNPLGSVEFVKAPDTLWHRAGTPYDWSHLKGAAVEVRRRAVAAYAQRPWQYTTRKS